MSTNVTHQRKVGLLALAVLGRYFHRVCLPSATGWPALALGVAGLFFAATVPAMIIGFPEGKLTATTGMTNDHCGCSVSLSGDGNTLLVGAYAYDTTAGINAGSAYVFARNGTNWSQQDMLTAADGAADDGFGRAVSLSSDGNMALVGAPSGDSPRGVNRGCAYVYVRTGANWSLRSKLTASDGAANDSFGYTVSLSGDGNTALMGAYADFTPYAFGGSAYVFVWDGTNWSQQAKLLSADGIDNDLFGNAVSLSGNGNTALVGAYSDDAAVGMDAGSAYVFVRGGSTWSQQAKLVPSDAAAADNFGYAVSVSGDGNTALVGAYSDDTAAGFNAGSASVFVRSGTNWSQQAKLTAGDGAATDFFGCSVSVSGDGSTALVGAYKDDKTAGLDAGSAYLFAWSGSNWSQQAQLTAGDGTASANFGSSVCLSSAADRALVGAEWDRSVGSAYVFRLVVPILDITLQQPAGVDLIDGSSTVDFGTVLTGAGSDRTFVITNPGTFNLTGLDLSLDGTNESDFAVTTFPAAPLAPGGSTPFTVTFQPSTAGVRSATLHLASNDEDESPFDIRLVGQGIQALTANLTAPYNGAGFAPPAKVALQAGVIQGQGVISRVDFFVGTNWLGTSASTNSPYSLMWSNVPIGTYLLRAVARDSLGVSATSSVVTVRVAVQIPTTTLLPAGSLWRYLDTGTNLGTAWKETGFNDSAWRSGRAQLGYGDGDETTVIGYGPDANNKYITTYFRCGFNVTNAAGFTNLFARMICDDGAVTYLNGIEVSRYNLPAGQITNLTPAITAIGGTDETNFFWSRRINPLLVREGTNILAVEVHQSSGSSTDLSFDLVLQGNVAGRDMIFPLTAGQRGTVSCLKYPSLTYDVYLPPTYTTNGPPLPILHTYTWGRGGGMVSDFTNVASSLQLILIGMDCTKSYDNWTNGYNDTLQAVLQDLRERVNYDPTAELAGGMSGGGLASFIHAKARCWQTAGVFSMGGWLGNQYTHHDRYETNLLVARSNGDNDTSHLYYLVPDSNHLSSFNAVIRDWTFPGGHDISPDPIKTECLTWLLSQRAYPAASDRSNAVARAAAWRGAIRLGQGSTVLRECLTSLQSKPRTWEAHHATMVLDDLQEDYAAFSQLDVSGLAGSDHASGDDAVNFFFYRAQGAGLLGDQAAYLSSLKCLVGITRACGERNPYFSEMLTNFGVPPPATLRAERNSATGGVALNFTRQSASLGYYPEGKNALSAAWQPRTGTLLTNQPGGRATWLLPREALPASFYRLRAQPE